MYVLTVNDGPKWSRTIQTVQNLPKTDLNGLNDPKPESSERLFFLRHPVHFPLIDFQIMMYSNFHFPL